MDDSQARSPVTEDEAPDTSGQMLPAVNVQENGEEETSAVPDVDAQTVPTDRALVTTPEEAADSDLIEKEWVLKAKHIVEHTSEDPFKQQEELSRMKADYMKKRYNKEIGTAS